MDFNNLYVYSLSELSFEYITGNNSKEEKKAICREIQRRFINNGCDFNTFINTEYNVINKRGDNINDYLIKAYPQSEDLFKVYFDYVYNSSYEHDNLLLSELMLCNSSSKQSFFTKCVKLELKNLKHRIEKNPKGEKLDKLEEIYVALYRRNNIEWFSPRYNSIVYAMYDIIPSNNSLYSDKIEEKENFYLKEFPDLFYKQLLLDLFLQNETLEVLNTRQIIRAEIDRLKSQKVSIIASLKDNKYTNYDNVDMEQNRLKILRK